jgi:hypothetical protein
MAYYDLFVSPGIGAADAARAKARYDGEDEKDDHLDEARIRSIAEEIGREHGLPIASEDDEGSGLPRGIDLEEEAEHWALQVRVDGWGVTVSVPGGDDDTQRAAFARRGVAVAEAASSLVGGRIYDTEREAIVERAGAALAEEVKEGLTRLTASRAATSVSFKRARVAVVIMVLTPMLSLTVWRRFLTGFPLFLAAFGTMVAAALFARWWAMRPLGAAPPQATPPVRPTASFDERPIKPS